MKLRTNRGLGWLSYKRSCSRQSRELNNYREVQVSLRPVRILMDQPLDGSMVLAPDLATTLTVAVALATPAVDQPRNLASKVR